MSSKARFYHYSLLLLCFVSTAVLFTADKQLHQSTKPATTSSLTKNSPSPTSTTAASSPKQTSSSNKKNNNPAKKELSRHQASKTTRTTINNNTVQADTQADTIEELCELQDELHVPVTQAVPESVKTPQVLTKERTFGMIKPDAVQSKHIGAIISSLEQHGFTIIDLKQTTFTHKQAESFYREHKEKSFYPGLVQYITSGPAIIFVLEKENAIKEWRELMGATNPAQAKPGTIRKKLGTDSRHNAVHGSDSPEAAKREIDFFFSKHHHDC